MVASSTTPSPLQWMSSPSLIANMCVRSRLTNCGEADAVSRQKAMQHTISCPDSTVTGLHLARKSARTICTALCRNTVRGCSPKLCAHRQTERSPSACESVCFGKAAIVRQQKNKALQKNTDSPKKKCRKQSKKKALQTEITKRTRKLQEATDKGLLYKRKQRQTSWKTKQC